MAYDVRGVANLVLDLADDGSIAVSNMAINKIVYFLHCHFVVVRSEPLVAAKIEAWEHGPVFRELYREFKKYEEKPITGRATFVDPSTGARTIAMATLSSEEFEFLRSTASEYLPMSTSALRALSHQPDGPWDQVWNHATLTNAMMQISDDMIRAWFETSERH